MKMKRRKTLILGAFIVMVFSCTKDGLGDNSPTAELPETSSEVEAPNNPTSPTAFNRADLLTNWADNIIFPAYDQFNTEILQLKTAFDTFTNDPNQAHLSLARAQWLETYKAWQHIEMFNIGKAEEIYFNNKMNIYPTNTERLENNIATAEYDLNNANNFAAQGFPALDYMLFGLGENDAQILNTYLENSQYSDYLLVLIETMVSNTNTIREAWIQEVESFKASTENTATSSLNKLTNDFIYYYEKGLRTNKIGIPAGVFSGSPLQGNVEAYYGKTYSKILAQEALKAVCNFFAGKAFGSNSEGQSFKTYLNYLNSTKNGDDLSGLIESKLQNAQIKLDSLNDNFALQIEDDNTALLLTFDALQEAVILLKVDMLQALSINVDYADADGD